MKNKFIFMLCVLLAGGAYAQNAEQAELNLQLKGKTKFYDIKNTVDGFFGEKLLRLTNADSVKKKQLGRQAKFWNRYFYESESRLTSIGEVENATAKIVDYLSTSHAAQRTEATSGSWAHIGPNNVSSGIGRINRIAFDPTNPFIAYAGSAGGGLYKTLNDGSSWQNVGSFIPSLGVSGIVVSHADANTIYVLTGDGDALASGGFTFAFGYIRYSVGILKSTDGGQTWNKTGNLPGVGTARYVGFELAQDPLNANTLIAATSRGLFKTTNSGSSWIACNTSNGQNVRVFDVKFKPGSSAVVYCTYLTNGNDANSCQFARSTDGGLTFQTTGITYSTAIDNADRITIGVTPANAAVVYILCGPGYVKADNSSNDTFEGLYRSTNSGVSFTRRSTSPDILAYQDALRSFENRSSYDLALAVSPTNENLIVAGGLVAWRSSNGGTSWTEIVDYFEDIDNSNYIHPDIHQLAFNPLGGKLYACTDGGVALSSDNGDNWTRRFNGLSCSQFYHFEPSNKDGDIWGGTQDNGIMIRQGTTSTFYEFDGGDGYDVLTDKGPAGNNDDKYWVINTKIWADGITDVNVTPDDVLNTPANFFPNLAMSPTNEDVIYAGYRDLRVSYSRGDNWGRIAIPGAGQLYVPGNWCVTTCKTNRKRVYSAGKSTTDQGIYRVDNLDDILPDEVTSLSSALLAAGYPSTDTKITDIAVSSNTSNRLWVTVGGYTDAAKVFYSNDAGANFINLSGTLPNLPVHTIVADGNDNVYIGTDIGVYYKAVNDADWTPFYNGLPRVAVSELELAATVSGDIYLYAATFGRGIWVSETFSNCASSADINQSLTGQRFFQAGDITSNSSLQGGAGTNVFFRAATSVTLYPEFIVNPGTELTAYIGPCNSGPAIYRTASGVDSNLSIIQNIESARQYGFVQDAVVKRTAVKAVFNVFSAGDYSVRVYDADTNRYLSIMPVAFATGMNTIDVPLKANWGKNLRVDLFKDDMLVHNIDFDNR